MTDYLTELEDLRVKLTALVPYIKELAELLDLLNKSYVNRYVDLVENSQWGPDCGYAVKAKNLFLAFQEAGISEKITELYEIYIKER